MPPDHGAAIVQTIMQNPELQADWDAELKEVRDRINSLRSLLVSSLRAGGTRARLQLH
jgi:aspartate/tyrosine/aromatic aminotransferase